VFVKDVFVRVYEEEQTAKLRKPHDKFRACTLPNVFNIINESGCDLFETSSQVEIRDARYFFVGEDHGKRPLGRTICIWQIDSFIHRLHAYVVTTRVKLRTVE
jgi:hypothetical protein